MDSAGNLKKGSRPLVPNANKKPPGNIRFHKESPTELPNEKRFEDNVSTADPKYVISPDGSPNPIPKETSSVPIQKKKTFPKKTKSVPPSVPSLETKPRKDSDESADGGGDEAEEGDGGGRKEKD